MAHPALSGRVAAREVLSAPHARDAPDVRQVSRRTPCSEFHPDQRTLMSFNHVPAGKDLPQDFNVIIEIPAQSDPVKYEADKELGLLVVDRFIGTGMRYPANYGFIPQTLSGDGDPVDVLVITPFPLLAGSVVRARALGMLQMTDESGVDAKLIAVPHDKICPMTADLKSIDDVPSYLKDQIKHFFEQYKALEKGKWVKVDGWADIDAAHKEISEGVANYKK
jgi:inorganic pyrophosphatase